MRDLVERLAGELGISDEAVFGLKVAATEAVANALRHPETPGHGVEVTIAPREDALEIEIENPGPFLIGDGLDPERGRGLPLMVALADEVEFAASPEGTRVVLRQHVERRAA
jgi:anti-sigma regulatory factor (Ser/Thr protein kinase)